jgi:hypothetical protein
LDQDLVVPLPRIGPESGRVRVVGVESEPLTAEQEAAAVRALSALIATWLANRQTAPDVAADDPPETRAA